MKKWLLASILACISFKLYAADYYWVGGAGNWSDINHWATTSGGTLKHSIVPSATDDVYFDANSGLAANSDVMLPVSGHAYCRNMNWTGVTVAANFRNTGSFMLIVSGNVVLSPSVRYGWQMLQFTGTSNATFTTNGASRYPAVGWYNTFEVNKTGSGSVTLTDGIPSSLVVYNVTLTSGLLDLSNHDHHLGNNLLVTSSNPKTLDITNSTITINGGADFRSTNTTLIGDNSFLDVQDVLHSSGLYFPKVHIGSASGSMQINGTGFGELVFTNTSSLPGTVRIGQNNTVRRLEFKSSGLLRLGGNQIDSLILASSKQHMFFETNTITKYIRLNSPDCQGLGELQAGNVTATLQFDAATVFDLHNVYIKGITAAGSVSLPISLQGADGGNNVGWNFTNPITGTTLYWVGGAGNWNDASHWSNISGGTGGYCIPFSADDVVFDANSGFTAGNNTVTSNASAWCRNMTWAGVTANPVFNKNNSFTMEVWGSIILDPTVTMNGELTLRGESAATLTSNGSSSGTFRMNIQKTGTNGGLTLSDDFQNLTTTIRLSSGKFLLPGRTLHIYEFVSSGGVRTIDITNASITTEYSWALNGTGRTWINNAAGSFIHSKGYFIIDGLTYPRLELSSNTHSFSIANATIGTIRFSNANPVSTAAISSGNTIDTLEFKGAGQIGNGNNINNLLLAPSRIYKASGTNTIHEKLLFNNPSCQGLGELRNNGATQATFQFSGSAIAEMDNVYLQGIIATGNGVPLTVTGADAGGNNGFVINVSAGGDRYWVGGSGDWNDASHWSTTSGGAGGACIPTVNDNVFFDAASFISGSSTVTTSVGNAYCNTMNWQGAANAPVFNESSSFNMEVWGNLVMNPAVTMNANIVFMGSTNSTLHVNGSTLGDFDFEVNKPSGTLSLAMADNLNNPNTRIILRKGVLEVPGRTLNIESFSDEGSSGVTGLNMTDAVITAAWNYSGANKTLQAFGSKLTTGYFIANGGTYNDVDIIAASSGNISVTNTTFGSLVFSNNSASSGALIGGGNTVRRLEFKGRGAIAGTGNTIDSLIFSPGKTYTLTAGTTTTITKEWFGSGTPCNLTEIVSSSTTANATVNKTGPVDLDYIRVRRITATGPDIPFVAREHSIDQGNNTGWDIQPYNGSTPIYGLGPDIGLNPADFPYVLYTDGFFASPLSQYTWNDASTGDSLVITGPGTYSVTVGFVDGCSVSDEIVVTLNSTLPVTLASFEAKEQNCMIDTKWEVASAINFASFILEKSLNGIDFSPVSNIPYNEQKRFYSYRDLYPETGTQYYRLKCIDVDGTYEYSKVVQVRYTCASNTVKVFPTISSNIIHVALPAGYEGSMIKVYNISGQQVNAKLSGTDRTRQLDISALPAASYFIRVNSKAGDHTFKITKQ